MANGTTQTGEKPEWLSKATPVEKPSWLSKATPVETELRPTPEAQIEAQERLSDPLRGQSPFGGLLGLSGAPTRGERLEASGLARGEGGGFRARAAASTGTLADVQANLASQFGVAPEEIDVGKFENELVFRNPKTGSYEPLDPAGLQIEDITPILTEAPVLALETLGGIGGAAALSPLGPGGATAGAIGGGAAGAAAGRALVSGGLSKLGVVQKTAEQIASEAGQEALIAGAGGTIPVVGAGLRTLASPTTRAAQRLSREGVTPRLIERGQAAVSDLQEETGAQFTTGQAVSQVEPEIGARLRATEVFAPGAGAAREAELAKTRRGARENIQGEIEPTTNVDIDRTAEDVSTAGRQEYERQKEVIVNKTNEQIQAAQKKLHAFSGRGPLESGEDFRKILEDGKQKVYSEISKQYDDLWSRVPDDVSIDFSQLRKTAKKWSNLIERRVLKELNPKDRIAVKNALNAGLNVEKGKEPNLASLTDELSLLKDIRRGLRAKTDVPAIQQRKLLDEVISDFETARSQALDSLEPGLSAQIKETDAAWASAKRAIDEALVGDILKKKGPNYTIESDKILNQAIKRPDALKKYVAATEDYPEIAAIPNLKEAIENDYYKSVVSGDASHENWVRENDDVLNLLYSKEELKKFSSAGKTKSSIDFARKNESDLLSELKEGFEYKLSRYEPEDVFKLTKDRPSRARKLKFLLETHPDKWENYKDVRKQKIVEDLQSGANLNNILIGDSSRELEVVLGDEYVNNLTRLNRLLQIEKTPTTDRLSRQISEPPESVFRVVRNFFLGSTIDPRSRKITSLGLFTRAATDRAMEKLLQDPDLLKRTLELRNAKIDSRPAKALFSELGLTGYLDSPGSTAEDEAREIQ